MQQPPAQGAGRRVLIGQLTRREFRQGVERGDIGAAVVPVGSTEQHEEHLWMIHDTASVAHVAEQAALRRYPHVVVATPIAIGVSEHWMAHPGTLTVRPEVFGEYVYDVCDALRRGGIRRILVLNGHGGNVRPLRERLDDFRARLGPDVMLQFHSYWDVYTPEQRQANVTGGRCPGHAGEFETSFALAAFPHHVQQDATQYDDALLATRAHGEAMVEAAVVGVARLLDDLLQAGL
jgi:creatinine amidohydrolase